MTEPGETPRKPAGRPRKWSEERRIEKIYEGRMTFQPGDPHPMDAQMDEARQLREQIVQQLAQVQGLVVELGQLDDPSVMISREEQAVTALLWEMYGSRKHREHIVATFIVARRRRMLQRLEAATVALEQARAFLTADTAILARLRHAVTEAETQALRLHGPPPPMPEVEEDAEQAELDEESPSEVRPDQGSQEEEDRQAERDREALLDTTGGEDDTTAMRKALSEFEARVRTMRGALDRGSGWFEWFFIPRGSKVLTPEARDYLEQGEEVPPDVQMHVKDDRPPYGPYLRYMWSEGKKKRYQIGMGAIKWRDRRKDDEGPPRL